MYYSFSHTLANTQDAISFNLWDSTRAGWGLGCFLLMSIFFGIFWSNCHEWRGPIWNWLNVCFQIRWVHSIHILSLTQLLALMFRFFTKLKDWVISVSFPAFPDVYCTPLKMSVFSLSVWRPLNMHISKKVTFGDLGSSWQTRDERTFIERASMYCADYPYLIKNLEAGKSGCFVFFVLNEVLWIYVSR